LYISFMEKVVRIVKKGEDDSNLKYWLSRSYQERLLESERIRQEVIKRVYGGEQRMQRVCRIVKKENKNHQ